MNTRLRSGVIQRKDYSAFSACSPENSSDISFKGYTALLNKCETIEHNSFKAVVSSDKWSEVMIKEFLALQRQKT